LTLCRSIVQQPRRTAPVKCNRSRPLTCADDSYQPRGGRDVRPFYVTSLENLHTNYTLPP
jgi:hypothetical protein